VSERVVVTGAGGFIGSNVLEDAVAAGSWAHGVDLARPSGSPFEGRAGWSALDLVTQEPEPGLAPTHVYHCAGAGTVGPSLGNPRRDFDLNVATTATLLGWVRAHAPSARVVLLSSAAVYGDQSLDQIPESTPKRPLSPYGSHKLLAEQLCSEYARQFDLRIAIVRFFTVYGPGLRKQLLWEACGKILGGQPEFGGDGGELRDWLEISDAVSLLRFAAGAASSHCPIFNGGTGKGTAAKAVLRQLARGLGRTEAIRFSGERRPGDPRSLVADIGAARRLGWEPKLPWQEGVSAYARWYLDQHQ
jgi:UDP-glucose 4-epimerase